MAETPAADSAGDSSKIIPNMTKPSALVDYMTVTYKMSEDEISLLRVAPTAELAQKFMACAFAKAKECEKLQAMLLHCKDKIGRPCQFMNLPPELRLKVYELVFADVLDKTPYNAKCTKQNGTVDVFLSRKEVLRRHLKTVLVLFHTNCAMRVEALPICIQLADAVRKSIAARHLQQLKVEWPHWKRMASPFLLEDIGGDDDLVLKMMSRERSNMLRRYKNVGETKNALEVVQRHLYEKHKAKTVTREE